eukprot:UN10223
MSTGGQQYDQQIEGGENIPPINPNYEAPKSELQPSAPMSSPEQQTPQQPQSLSITPQEQPLLAKQEDNGYSPSKDKSCRSCAIVFGLVAVVLLVSAMACNDLASGRYKGNTVRCTLIGVKYDDERLHYYHEECLEHEDWPDIDFSDDEYCATWAAASVWIGCLTFGLLFLCIGNLCVQPMCQFPKYCCTTICPRVMFIIALLFCIVANIVWVQADQACMDEDEFNLNLGLSFYIV